MTYTDEYQDEVGGEVSDPRRCRWHPEVVTSSADGMFDGLCGLCEGERDAERAECDAVEAMDDPRAPTPAAAPAYGKLPVAEDDVWFF